MTTFNKLIYTLLLTASFFGVSAQTTVPSIISSSATWDASGSPYIVSQNVLIKKGSTIKVMPGTKIRATGNFRILVEGGLEAIGTKDSVINMDTISFEFLDSAVGYDFTSKTGSIFKYCYFVGVANGGSRTISINRVPLLISNCKFSNTYYSIYGINANKDSVLVRVEKTIFQGNYGGYAIYPIGNNTFVEMDECEINSMYGLYLAGHTLITGCSFYNILTNSGISIGSSNKDVIFKCNTFRKFRNTIFNIYGANSANNIVIVSNTFDSSDYHIDLLLSGSSINKMVVKNNNFLQFNKNSVRVRGGSTPGHFDTIVMTKNYWGTTDTNAIKAGIFDFNDDITVAGLVDFSLNLTSENTNCIEDDSIEYFRGGTGSGSGSTSVRSVADLNISVYPNPADKNITIESDNLYQSTWVIYNLEGRMVRSGEFNSNQNTINTEDLTAGYYTLEINKQNQSSATHKLLIKH